MRQFEEPPIDPDVFAELEAIDATLRGEAVDPAHAELAELALLLASERVPPSERFARELDTRATRRFAPPPPAPGTERHRRRLVRVSRPLLGGALVGALALTAAAVVIAHGSLSPTAPPRAVGGAPQGATRSPLGASQRGAANGTAERFQGGSAVHAGSATHAGSGAPTKSTATLGTKAAPNAFAPNASAPSLAIGSAGRQIQSAQLQLSTPNAHIDQVAQEVYDLVALENGRVERSTVTQAADGAGAGSYASFTLSIPTTNLQQTITRASSLHYATVVSRTDGTQDVSDQYSSDQRHIADQEALRSSLLTQLQSADTAQAIDSIKAQLKLVESQLSADQSALAKLRRQITYSILSVQVNAAPLVTASHASHGSSGFTLGRAAHDAGRVLVVAAGVALIALALLVPLSLLAALISWGVYRLRRRRREHALDAH